MLKIGKNRIIFSIIAIGKNKQNDYTFSRIEELISLSNPNQFQYI